MPSFSFDRRIISRSLAETEELASQFFDIIEKPGLVALYGTLGAGKTCFVRYVAAAAGVDPDEVSSPSYTLVNEYPQGSIPIYHLDLYRIESPEEIHSIGIDDYLNRDGIILIEWAEKGEKSIPSRRYNVHLEIIDESTRAIEFSKVGL